MLMKERMKKISVAITLGFFLFAPLAHADTITGTFGNLTGTPSGSSGFGINGASGAGTINSFKQKFTTTGFIPNHLYLPMFGDGTSGSSVTVKLCTASDDSVSDPCLTTIVTENFTTVSLPTTRSAAFASPTVIDLPSDTILSPGTTYVIVVSRASGSGTDFTRVAFTGSGYTDGSLWAAQNSCPVPWVQTENPASGCSSTEMADYDIFFGFSGASDTGAEYGVGPTTTIYSPPMFTVIPYNNVALGVEARAYSSTLSASDTAEGTTFDWLIFKDGTLAGFKLDQHTDLIYLDHRADRVIFPAITSGNGTYEIRARSCLGAACGVYTRSIFTVADAGSATDTALFGTSEPFPTWDGSLGTLGSWIKDVVTWLVIPPSIGSFDPTPIFDLLQTRWPFSYVFGPIGSWQAGYAAGSACPMPTFLGSTIMGQTMPTFDLCTTLEGVGDAIEANTWGKGVIQWAIYLSALFFVLRAAENLHKGKKK